MKAKKILAFFLVLIIVLTVFAACGEDPTKDGERSEEDRPDLPTSEGLEFEMSPDFKGYTLISLDTCKTSDIVLNTYNDVPITRIADKVFQKCEGLTSITFGKESMITEIGSSAFEGCTGLESIVIPSSVEKIDPTSFYGCTNLESIIVEGENETYESKDNCIIEKDTKTLVFKAKDAKIPDGVKIIGAYSMSASTSNKSITIPDSVKTIGSSAFRGCAGLKSISIPESVTTIGDDAFYGCTGLTSVTVPKNVTEIGYWVFYGCENIKTANIPMKMLRDIRSENLETVVIHSGESITSITFDYCENLKSVTILDGITSIDLYAFKDCKNLTDITIPASVTSIRSSAFEGCTQLARAKFENTEGWERSYTLSGTRPISASDLADEEKAAELLLTHSAWDWSCTTE